MILFEDPVGDIVSRRYEFHSQISCRLVLISTDGVPSTHVRALIEPQP